MLFNSMQFVIFFPIVIFVYYILPEKVRKTWLLIASYFFYMCWDAKYVLLLFAVTFTTWAGARAIEKISSNLLKRRILFVLTLLFNVGILLYFKYFSFLAESVNSMVTQMGLKMNSISYEIILPVGISFFVFQSIGYLIDVYKGDVIAEKNLGYYALFVSFFPQLVAGPIERSKNLLKQIKKPFVFDYESARYGLLLMLWGYFEKLLIADQAAKIVDNVYGNFQGYAGSSVIFATLLFSIQIYCDFAGYSHIAIGAAKVMNIHLMENFRQPYLAQSIQDFWTRWHISLSSWLRDYVYIPLGGNRKGQIKKCFNLFITFVISGIWHGANWTFLIWGVLHGLYLIIGEITKEKRIQWAQKNYTVANSISFKIIRMLITFGMVSFAWIFFRAESISQAFQIIYHSIRRFKLSAHLCMIYELGLDERRFRNLTIAIIILFIVDFIHEKNIKVSNYIFKQDKFFRWFFYLTVTFLLIVNVIENYGLSAANFIYFQF